jgi:hypothetical protein
MRSGVQNVSQPKGAFRSGTIATWRRCDGLAEKVLTR